MAADDEPWYNLPGRAETWPAEVDHSSSPWCFDGISRDHAARVLLLAAEETPDEYWIEHIEPSTLEFV